MLAELFRPSTETRAVQDPKWNDWASGADIGIGYGNTAAGVPVNADAALALATVYACVTLRSETLQAMPVRAYRQDGDRRDYVPGPRWLDQPNPETSWAQLVDQIMLSMDLHGDAHLLPVRDQSMRVSEVWVAHPDDVQVVRPDPARPRSVLIEGQPYQKEVVQVALHRMPGALRGMNPVMHAKETFGLASAAQNYGASWFGQGSVPSGVLETDGGLTSDQAQEVRQNWTRSVGGKRRAALVGVLHSGMKYKPITVPPETAQFLETRNFSAAELCGIYKVPPDHVAIALQGTSLTYQNVESAYLALIRRALMAPMRIIEDAMSNLMPTGQRMRFVPDVFLKPDTVNRYGAHRTGIEAGFLTVDEARALEDLPPLGG